MRRLMKLLNHDSDLTLSQRNIPLSYIGFGLSMFMLMMPVRILLMQQTLTNAQISVLIATIFASIVIWELPTGALADLLGKKITIQLGYLTMAVALGVYIWAGNFWQFGIAVFLQGLAESLKSGAQAALQYDSLVEDGREVEFKKINSRAMTIVQFSMVGATFAGGMLGTIDLRLPFVLSAVLLLLATTVLSFMKEPTVDTKKFTFKNYVKQTIEGTQHIFQNAKIAKLSILYMLVGGISWTFQRLLRDMILIEVGYGQLAIGLVGGSFRLVNILFLAWMVNSVRANTKGWDIVFLPILMVITYGLGVFLGPATSLPIVAGIMMAGTGRFLIYNPYLHQEIESRYRATASSAANLLVSLFLAINMFALGGILDSVTLPTVLVGYGILSLLIVVPLSFLVRKDFA